MGSNIVIAGRMESLALNKCRILSMYIYTLESPQFGRHGFCQRPTVINIMGIHGNPTPRPYQGTIVVNNPRLNLYFCIFWVALML